MKGRTLIVAIAVIHILLFSACSEDSKTYTLEDLAGNWVTTATPHPGSVVYTFNAAGTYTQYSNYGMDYIEDGGIWGITDSTMVFTNTIGDSEISYSVDNTNHFSLAYTANYYRLGTVPYCQGQNSATGLTVDDPAETFTQSEGTTQWYSFSAVSGTDYAIYVDDNDNLSGSFDGDVKITVVGSDLTTFYAIRRDDAINSHIAVTGISSDETIYIIIDMVSTLSGNNYSIEVIAP